MPERDNLQIGLWDNFATSLNAFYQNNKFALIKSFDASLETGSCYNPLIIGPNQPKLLGIQVNSKLLTIEQSESQNCI